MLKSTGIDSSKEGHDVSLINDMKRFVGNDEIQWTRVDTDYHTMNDIDYKW